MISKTYVADTLEDIIKQAHSELGQEVYVIKHEEFKQKKGLFKKQIKQRAVIATLEKDDISHIKELAIAEYEEINLPKIQQQQQDSNSKTEQIINEQMNELKLALRKMSLKMDSIDTKKLYPKAVQELEQMLKKQDTDSDTISKIIIDVTMNLTTEEHNDPSMVFEYAGKYIERLCSDVKSITSVGTRNKIVMFVGGTGVGKTTSISKLSTILKNSEATPKNQNPVGVITLDTFREGAIEQLKNLCDYTGIPVEVANSKQSFEQALEKFSDKKYVFIDTTGRSQHNLADIKKIQDILGEHLNDIDEVYLVMSATTKYRDMLDIYDSFKWMGINRVVFSKLDESRKIGNILSFIDTNPTVSLSYLTIGQRVPSDIELVRPNKISDLILNQRSINQLI